MDAVIEARELYKTFRLGTVDVEILKNINLAIARWEFVSIMGSLRFGEKYPALPDGRA